MRFSLALSLVPLAAFVGALKVVEPKEGAIVDSSKSLDVKWTSVENDASNFNIYLTNNEVYPPVNKKVASDVKASKESYTVDSLDATAGHGYRINLVSDAKLNTGILAQSPQFNVTESAHSSHSSSTSTSASTSTSTGTSTETTGTFITTTDASKATASGSLASGSARNASSSAAPTASTGAGASVVANPILAGLVAGAFALTL